MDREDQIRQEGDRLMEDFLKVNLPRLMFEYKQKESEHLEKFIEALRTLFDEGRRMQEAGDKNAVSYLAICYCKSSVFTGHYELKLDLYDTEFYLDEQECSVYWEPDFIFSFLEEDIKYFQKNISKRVPRIRTYEIQRYLMGYVNNYMYILSEFLRQKMPEVLEQVPVDGLETNGKLQVLFGEYMGKMKVCL